LFAGESLDLDEENFCLFDSQTQTFVPEADVVNISSQDDDSVKRTDNKSFDSLKNKMADVLGKATVIKKTVVDAEVISSDDDFVTPKTRLERYLLLLRRERILLSTRLISPLQGGLQKDPRSGVDL
jgi:hypothetical protein